MALVEQAAALLIERINNNKPIKTKKLLNEILTFIKNFHYEQRQLNGKEDEYHSIILNNIVNTFIDAIDFNKTKLETKHVAEITNLFHPFMVDYHELHGLNWFKKVIDVGYMPTHAIINSNIWNISSEDFITIIKKLDLDINLIFKNIHTMIQLFHHNNCHMIVKEHNIDDLTDRFNTIDQFIEDNDVDLDFAFTNLIGYQHLYKHIFDFNVIYSNILHYKTYRNIPTPITTILSIKQSLPNLYKTLLDFDILYEKLSKSDLEQINFTCFLIFAEQPEFFKKIYNDDYDEELLGILSMFISKDKLFLNLFKMCVSSSTENILTQQLFELYCKIGNLEIIEIFLQNKFTPTDDLILKIYSDNLIDIIKLFNKYNYYITEKCFEYIWINYNIYLKDDLNAIRSISVYVNNENEFNKFLPDLNDAYYKHLKKVNTNTNIGSIFRNYNYNKKLVDLDDIVLCNDIRLRKELYEIYIKQNKEIKHTKIIKKIKKIVKK